MVPSASAFPTSVIRVGADRVTIRGEEIIIDARRRFADWQVRELNPVPIYFQERKYLMVQSSRGHAPFAARYVLKQWPENLISNSTRFHTYDEAVVAERDTGSRGEQM